MSLQPFLWFSTCSAVLVLLNVVSVQCLPVDRITKRAAPVNDDVLTYLSTYGYLPQSDLETGNLRTDDQLKDAIRTLQRYGHIPVTGKVDEQTKKLLKSPRCGIPDNQPQQNGGRMKRYVTQNGRKWESNFVTWSLKSRNLRLKYDSVRRELYKAFGLWANNSRLQFKESASNDAEILISFQGGKHDDDYPFDGRGTVLAHAFPPGPGRGGDVHFDSDELWIDDDRHPNQAGTSLFSVAAHELGHSLGLMHSSVEGALMYPWYQGVRASYELPEDDREGIQRLYGAPERGRGDRHSPYNPQRPTSRFDPWKPRPPSESPTYYTPRTRPTPPPPSPPPPPTRTPPRLIPSGPTTRTPDTPDRCDTNYDAISVMRTEVFIFKGKYFWRKGENGFYSERPELITRMWNKLPENLTHIDAVYERLDSIIIFFVGREVYAFDGNTLLNGYPIPLTYLGLPPDLDHIDAAMIWGHNKKTYFFSGMMYWKYDDEIHRVDGDYPRDMSFWKGIGYNIDTAFQWIDGNTYFFKDKRFMKFDNERIRVTDEHLTQSPPFKMGCAPKALENNPSADRTMNNNQAQNMLSNSSFFITIICILVAVICILAGVIIVIRKRKTHSYTRPKRDSNDRGIFKRLNKRNMSN